MQHVWERWEMHIKVWKTKGKKSLWRTACRWRKISEWFLET
jgi:hypothetical protein